MPKWAQKYPKMVPSKEEQDIKSFLNVAGIGVTSTKFV